MHILNFFCCFHIFQYRKSAASQKPKPSSELKFLQWIIFFKCLYGQILLPKKWFQDTTSLFRPRPYHKIINAHYFLDKKLLLLKKFKFWRGLRFLRFGLFAILKYAITPKTIFFILKLQTNTNNQNALTIWNIYMIFLSLVATNWFEKI